jgi:glycosyltransferase involved in cell wall biosynthesis
MNRVSIIVPMRDAEQYINAALDSVLANATTPCEVVVIDDGSTDHSRALVKARQDERIRIIDGPGTGLANAVNAGLEAASGDIIVRCDADDLYPANDRLQRQVDWLAAHPAFAAICGGFSIIDQRGRYVSNVAVDHPPGEITEELQAGHVRTHMGTYAIRRETFNEVGGLRDWFTMANDVDFQFRLAEVGRVWYEPKVNYCYRVHDGSITHQAPTTRRRFEDQAAVQFARQRREQGEDDLMRGCPPAPPDGTTQEVSRASEQVQAVLLGQAWRQRQTRQPFAAVATGLRACLVRPRSIQTWRSWVALTLRG